MRQSHSLRKIFLALFAAICLPVCALAGELYKEPGQGVPPLTEDDTWYVMLDRLDQPNAGTGFFSYNVFEKAGGQLVQNIRVERDVKVLYVAQTMDVLTNPENYISLQDLNGDGVDDLKVLSENGGGEGEPVYIAYCWDEGERQFVLQDEWPVQKDHSVLLWGGALLGVVIIGGVLLWRRGRKSRKAA